MTATITVPTTSTPTSTPTTRTTRRPVWKTGLVAGAGAAVATSVFAAAADALGVSLAVGGEAIPVAGFAQITFVAALVGTALAAVFARRARRPMRTFVRTTVALTALSFVPDVLADAPNGTRLTLALSHVVAAVIVIPALASRLSD